jgi:alanyl-tRNA synthetase
MKAREIRQSFLDFFQSKEHQVVSSASLLPESPNLLFTNAGMNQFVPYFLGDQQAPYPRAADTQKCIRARTESLKQLPFDFRLSQGQAFSILYLVCLDLRK